VAAAGVEVIRPEKEAFAEKVAALYEEYRDQ
jgi:TRAP-type C4-dicarboxylate transport system substrate-binding protein